MGNSDDQQEAQRRNMAVLFHEYVSVQWDSISREAEDIFAWIEEDNFINGPDGARQDLMLAWLTVFSVMMHQSTERMARAELQTQSKDTQYGCQLAREMDELSNKLLRMVTHLRSKSGEYAAVLAGRRGLVHYTDSDGGNVPYSKADIENYLQSTGQSMTSTGSFKRRLADRLVVERALRAEGMDWSELSKEVDA